MKMPQRSARSSPAFSLVSDTAQTANDAPIDAMAAAGRAALGQE